MPADLDLLLITVYCTVDDRLPRRAGNAGASGILCMHDP